jgi:hypothetical protein
MTDDGRLIRPHLGVVTAGSPCRAWDGRRCADDEPTPGRGGGPCGSGRRGRCARRRGDIADPGVQPDGVVVGADHLQFSAELVGVAAVFQVGPLALDVPEERLDRSLVGGSVRGGRRLDDRAPRQDSLVDPEVIWGPLSDTASSSGRVGSSTARSTRPSWRAATSSASPRALRHRWTRPRPGWRSPRRCAG